MSNKEILEKAIQKAIEGGWENEEGFKPITVMDYVFLMKDYTPPQIFFSINELIFNHSFCKALWGEQPTRIPAYSDAMENWQFHLQKMVIADDPIKYLGENI